MKKLNRMDTRNRSGLEVITDLRAQKGFKLAILGSHQLDARETADALLEQSGEIFKLVGDKPVRILTGCANVGAEKAARLAAKDLTGKLAAVFHRADLMWTAKVAEKHRDILLAQESNALLVLTTGGKICKHAQERFRGWNRKIYEVEIG